MSWTTATFEDAPVEIIDGDRGKNYPSQNQLLEEGHCLFLSATNVTKSGFAFEACQFVSQEKHEALRKGTVDYDDIILTTRGTLGNVARYTALLHNFNRMDSHRESMRLEGRHDAALTRPLPHDELVQLQCFSAQARVAADLAGQGDDLACAA